MAAFQLEAFFAEHGARAWQPGQVDCLLMLADYAVALGYPDPAAHLRGAYDSEDGFRSIIEQAGGVVPLVAGCAGRIGAKRLQQPLRGAIGVIGSAGNVHRQFGAIYDGERWIARLKENFTRVTANPLAIWAI